jgi:mono/diheme cytochrome c family protein
MNRRTPNIIAAVLLLAAAGIYTGCRAPRTDAARTDAPRAAAPPTNAIADLTPRQQTGRLVYMHICNQCHPGGNAGLGPSLNTKPLPSFVIKTQVRMGMGAMPPFDEQQITDNDLTAVVDYLDRIRGRTRPR